MRRLRSERGLTLVELMVAMPLMLVVLAGVVTLLVRSSAWGDRVQQKTAQQGDVRAVVTTLVADLRQAYRGDTFPVKSIGPSAIDFYSPDRSSPFRLREIAYRLVGGTLQRQTKTSLNVFSVDVTWQWPAAAAPWIDQLHELVANRGSPAPPLLAYYDDAGSLYTGSDPTKVRRVVITLTASSGSAPPATFTYTDSVLLRESFS